MSATINIPPIGYGALRRLERENVLLRSVVDVTSDLSRDPWQTAAGMLGQLGEFVGARRAMVAEVTDDRLRSAGVWRAAGVTAGEHLGASMKAVRNAARRASGTFLLTRNGAADPRLVEVQQMMQLRGVEALILVLPEADSGDTVVMAFEVPHLGGEVMRDAAVITAFAASINAMLALQRRITEGEEVIHAVRALSEISADARVDQAPHRIQSALAICRGGVGAQSVHLLRRGTADVHTLQSAPMDAPDPVLPAGLDAWLGGDEPLPLTWFAGGRLHSAHRVIVGAATWGALVCVHGPAPVTPDPAHSREHSRVRSLADDLLAATAGWIGGEVVRAESVQRLAWREADLATLVVHQQGLGESRRKEVVRELNDEVGQLLAAQLMDLDLLRATAQERGDDADVARLTDIIDAQYLIVATVRAISSRLRPALLDDEGLAAAVQWYATAFGDRAGLQVDVRVDDIAPAREAGVRDDLFRILEELLANVERHAHAEHVHVSLTDGGTEVLLAVEDDGVGIGARADGEPRLGIIGIQERAKRHGGNVEFSRMGESGTCVQVSMPLESA